MHWLPPQGPSDTDAKAPDAQLQAYAGTCVSVDGDTVDVYVGAFSDERPHTARYNAPSGPPTPGEACTVLFTDGGAVALFYGSPP